MTCTGCCVGNHDTVHMYDGVNAGGSSPASFRYPLLSLFMPSTQRAQLATIDEQLIERVAQRIVDACDPEAIYLFGSAARGDAGPESDLDLLIVTELEDDERFYEKASQLRRLFDGWLVSFDILVQSPRDFSRAKAWPGHIAYTASREGTLLYRRASHA